MNAASQTLEWRHNGKVLETYPVSTSKFGFGTEEGSFKTPSGSFVIVEKIGADAPLFSIFKSRIPTGEISSPGGEEDQILTRILWLEGKDKENVNTYNRYIYIHGTNQEHLLGTPASHGCVRMKNSDIALLFDQVNVGTRVRIIPS